MKTGYLLIGLGVAIAVVLYLWRNPSSGPKVPTGQNPGSNNPAGGTGPASSCGATVCLGASLDGSSDPVSVAPQAQTEAAYNVDPTDTADAFGPAENDTGDDDLTNV